MQAVLNITVMAGDSVEQLHQTLEAIRKQVFSPFECVVVVHAAFEKVAELGFRYMRVDQRFRVVNLKAVTNESLAIQAGLRAAHSDFFKILRAGDTLSSEYLAQQVQLLKANKPSEFRRLSVQLSKVTPQAVDIAFLPHKDYHVWSIALLRGELEKVGLSAICIDPSAHTKEEGVARKAKELGLPLVPLGDFMLGNYSPKAVLAFNDWELRARSILSEAQASGIASISLVEGVQDYLDSDTGRVRHAYRSSETVLLPGGFDSRYFDGSQQTIAVAGVPRIEELLLKKPMRLPDQPTALINSNFSYGVLEDERDHWLTNCVEACRVAGFKPVISRHPADDGTLFSEFVTSDSFYDALNNASLVISRFGSAIIEAPAMGRAVIYYPPQGEKLDKFMESQGAYPIVRDQGQLIVALQEGQATNWEYQKQFWSDHIKRHALTSNGQSSASAIVSAIKEAIKRNTAPDFTRFHRALRLLDRKSCSLTYFPVLKQMYPPLYPRT